LSGLLANLSILRVICTGLGGFLASILNNVVILSCFDKPPTWLYLAHVCISVYSLKNLGCDSSLLDVPQTEDSAISVEVPLTGLGLLEVPVRVFPSLVCPSALVAVCTPVLLLFAQALAFV
jgi:hypothetical protein